MPVYDILETTFVSHMGKTFPKGDTVRIDWPPGTEPKTLGDNMKLSKAHAEDLPTHATLVDTRPTKGKPRENDLA